MKRFLFCFLALLLIVVFYSLGMRHFWPSLRWYHPLEPSVRSLSLDRFGTAVLVEPDVSPRDLVIAFVPDNLIPKAAEDPSDNWLLKLAKLLAEDETSVVLVSADTYLSALQGDLATDSCLYLAGELRRFSQVIAKDAGHERFITPKLLGIDVGAAIAEIGFFQHPEDFAGLVTIATNWTSSGDGSVRSSGAKKGQYESSLPLSASICPGQMLETGRGDESSPRNGGFQIASSAIRDAKGGHTPWLEFGHNLRDSPLDQTSGRSPHRVFNTTSSSPSSLPDLVFHEYQFAFSESTPSLDKDDNSLPIIAVPISEPRRGVKIIFFSGDGGWATIDREVGEHLGDNGVEVIGFDSLKYFWQARQPSEVAKVLDSLLAGASTATSKSNVILAGFSFGADVLPAVFPLLSVEQQRSVSGIILLSPTKFSTFEVDFIDWLPGIVESVGDELLPLVNRLQLPVLCLYGADERDETVCTEAKTEFVQSRAVGDSHHFDGEYEVISRMILEFVDQLRR